jgi:hypothetical protein
MYTLAPTATANNKRIPVPKSGTVTAVYFEAFVAGTLGTTESCTLKIRQNNTTDITVNSAITLSAVSNHFSGTGLTMSVSAGDYLECKFTSGAWVTPPTTASMNVTIYIT